MPTKREQIKQAIANTRAFREWITENVPKRNINLNVWLRSGTDLPILTAPLREVISCGTIGCLGGWADIYLHKTESGCRHSAHSFLGGDILHGHDFDPLFSSTKSALPHVLRDDRRACLRRLDTRIAKLSKALLQA